VPPALAGIGASTAKRPLAYGAVGLVAAAIVLGVPHDALAVAALIAAAVVTALSAVATVVAAPSTQIQPGGGQGDARPTRRRTSSRNTPPAQPVRGRP
jgi:hypothetical protein